jgi:lycopene cyclase CruP
VSRPAAAPHADARADAPAAPRPLAASPPAHDDSDLIATLTRAGGGSLARGVLARLPTAAGEPPAARLLDLSEAYWTALRTKAPKKPAHVLTRAKGARLASPPDFDVAVVGGTLGLLLASSLQAAGHRVVIVERRLAVGRDQEWNACAADLGALVSARAVTRADVDAATVTACGPLRVAFHGDAFPCAARPLYLEGALDVGVSPRLLLASARRRFEAAGGVVLERAAFKSATIADDGVELTLAPSPAGAADAGDASRPAAVAGGARPPPPRTVTARLVVDAAGHWSPLAAQARGAEKPAGVCLVVGACYRQKKEAGDPAHSPSPATGDFLATHADASLAGGGVQWLWETFPADGGNARTAYQFAYIDATPDRPSLTEALDTFFESFPEATGDSLATVDIQRVLFGAFPQRHVSPLPPAIDRVLHVGDAAGAASPLSFGGFGAMLRALPRTAAGVSTALARDRLDTRALAPLAPYSPGAAASRLFAAAMRLHSGGGAAPVSHVNRLLASTFRVLALLGPWALTPFLGERLRPAPLAATMGGMALAAPASVARAVRSLGVAAVAAWTGHAMALAAYAAVALLLTPLAPILRRTRTGAALLAAVAAGAGADGPRGHRIAAAPAPTGA